MATVTALRAAGRERVAIELDGGPWRTLPLEAVVRAGIVSGSELDRPTARALRRELRRLDALGRAARSLRTRDLPARELARRLERGGVAPAHRAEALDALQRAGLVDDRRFARARAAALAARGYGDAAIAWELERRGVEAALARDAVSTLEPEAERARAVVAARGASAATARLLARRGFSEDAVQSAAGADA